MTAAEIDHDYTLNKNQHSLRAKECKARGQPRVYSCRVLLGDFASLDVQNTYRGSDAYDTISSN
ncbi:hypothetical protein [Piscirickettsia salmonis]|uniref:hypothetical protein n=1 Tax=Piscirickettsia salmonis TaxID=1238 RepID=UPI001E49423B|nr:hypothetical protein [Piscirickettsia salmonis]